MQGADDLLAEILEHTIQRKEKRGDLGWRQGISIGQHSSDTYVLWRSCGQVHWADVIQKRKKRKNVISEVVLAYCRGPGRSHVGLYGPMWAKYSFNMGHHKPFWAQQGPLDSLVRASHRDYIMHIIYASSYQKRCIAQRQHYNG